MNPNDLITYQPAIEALAKLVGAVLSVLTVVSGAVIAFVKPFQALVVEWFQDRRGAKRAAQARRDLEAKADAKIAELLRGRHRPALVQYAALIFAVPQQEVVMTEHFPLVFNVVVAFEDLGLAKKVPHPRKEEDRRLATILEEHNILRDRMRLNAELIQELPDHLKPML